MFSNLGSAAAPDMADYYLSMLTHLRNHTEVLRNMDRETGLHHESVLSLLNVTQEDLEFMFNTNRIQEQRAPCYCSGPLQEIGGLLWTYAIDRVTTDLSLRFGTYKLVHLQVAASYRLLHGYLSLLVCVFGSIANLLNIVVLTRKELVGAPINRILTGIAVADLLVMLEYIPFAVYSYMYAPRTYTEAEAVYVLIHMHFSQLLHTVSICLTLTLALWRYIAIQFPHRSQTLCSPRHCTLALGMAIAVPVLICVPYYLVFSVKATRVTEGGHQVILYHLDLSDLAKVHDERLYTVTFWLYAVVVKLLPCAVLTVVSFCLIKVLWRVKSRKQRLRCNLLPVAGSQEGSHQRTYKPGRRVDRTTKMLVAVLLLFLITEVPQGILGLLSGILGRCFFKNCYHKLGEVMDILALINGAITFILYCSMSRQFRDTFSKMFKPKLLAKGVPPNTDVHSTYV